MSLHQRISEIFMPLAPEAERMAFSNRLEQRFLVRDGGLGHDLRVILLVESPHKDEVSQSDVNGRFPLAGSTGQHVRERLNSWISHWTLPARSIGQLVHEGCNAVQQLRIMNVSRLPLQSSAYASVQRNWRHMQGQKNCLRCMERIRSAPCANYRGFPNPSRGLRSGYLKEEIHQLRLAIAEDLRGRLDHIRRENPSTLLICCGRVAQAFYLRAGVVFENTCCFPHPSYGGWRSVDAAKKQKLIDALSTSS